MLKNMDVYVRQDLVCDPPLEIALRFYGSVFHLLYNNHFLYKVIASSK